MSSRLLFRPVCTGGELFGRDGIKLVYAQRCSSHQATRRTSRSPSSPKPGLSSSTQVVYSATTCNRSESDPAEHAVAKSNATVTKDMARNRIRPGSYLNRYKHIRRPDRRCRLFPCSSANTKKNVIPGVLLRSLEGAPQPDPPEADQPRGHPPPTQPQTPLSRTTPSHASASQPIAGSNASIWPITPQS